ncbi:MAG: trypsin-like peptidase domain-containing protein [Cellvibrionales bacterium]|nr:trypsin-like peptidase domain-containing protein [Cellvibrionales bacterium]
MDYFWPSLCGLLVAVLVSLLAPDWLAGNKRANDAAAGPRLEAPVGPVSYAAAVRRAAPSVVNVYTTKTVAGTPNPLLEDPFFRRFFDRSPQAHTRQQRSLGSGVIISAAGQILTNAHVIAGAEQILVLLADGRQAVAQLVGVDRETDLAVLSIELDGLQAIPIGDPNRAQVGDAVLAIGNPFGFGQTVTQGIISATGRDLVDLSSLVSFLQTDAAINDGSSGGALIDAYGNLLGINSRKLQSDGGVGLGFAIPADIALKVVRDLVDLGAVVRGWLGVEAQPISAQAASELGLDTAAGMLITGLHPSGPAHRAGLEVGDLILRVNEREVRDPRQLINRIANSAPGARLNVAILRAGQPLTVIAELDARPEPEQPL